MIKYHKIISVILGLLFLIVEQEFATPEPIFRFLVPAFMVLLGIVWLYNRWYLKKIQKYNIWVMVRPALLLAGTFGVFLLIPTATLRGFFLLFSVGLIAAVEYFLGNFAENAVINETLIVSFYFFISFAAYSQYFPSFNYLFVAGTFAAAALLTRSFYDSIPQPNRTKQIASLAMGLFCSELFWALSFLPLHYSVLALVLFNVFYFSLVLNYYYLFNILNFKKIQFHLALIAFCSVAVLVATPWKIIT